MEQQKRGRFQQVRGQDGDYSVKHHRCDGKGEPRRGHFDVCVCSAIVHQLPVTSLMAPSTLPGALKTSVTMVHLQDYCCMFISRKAITGQGRNSEDPVRGQVAETPKYFFYE